LLDQYQWLNELRQNEMQSKPQEKLVQLVEFPETKLAVLEHKGSPNTVMNSVQQFIQWRKQVKCHPSKHATYNIIYDGPALVAADDYRFDIATAYDRDIVANEFGVIAKTIPYGLCAMLRHVGSDLTLGESIGYLYGQWLVESGHELRDFPCFLHRVTMFPDVSEQEMIIDIYLPIVN
jgi:AraC family transcriptional regulator